VLTTPDLIFAIALPLLLAAGLFAFRHKWVAPVALGVGLALSVFGTNGWPGFPPVDAIQWLGFLAIVWMIVGVIDSLRPWPTIARLAIAILVALVTVWLISANQRPNWSSSESILWIGGFTLAIFGLTISTDRLLARTTPGISALQLALLAIATAMVIAMTGSQSLANRAGTLAVVLIIAFVWSRRSQLGRGTAIVFVPLWAAILIAHWLYAASESSPLISFLLLTITPPLCWFGQIPAIQRRSRWTKWAIQLSLVIVPLAVAVILVAIPFARAIREFE